MKFSAALPLLQRSDAAPLPSEMDGERRLVTVLFADLVGYTAFTAQAGAEHAYRLIRWLSKLLIAAVQEQGCTVKALTGDGILALFGAPVSFEDAPLRACRAALLIEQRLAEAADEIAARHGVRPQLRMSINSGPVVFAEAEEGSIGAHGDIVNLGSHLLAVTEPGCILIGEQTQRFVEGMVESRFAGTFQLKGKAAPQRAYRLLALRDDATRFAAARRRGLTSFVGRSDKLAVLDGRLRDLRGLHLVDIDGDPGIGKSRLLHEFKQRIPADEIFVLSGGCLLDGQRTPLLPFIEVVRGLFGLARTEPRSAITAKLERGLDLLGLGGSHHRNLLLNLLGLPVEGMLDGLDGTLIGIQTRDLLLDLLEAHCRLSPVVVLLEDLHWIDGTSEELLERIIDRGETMPLLIVATRRSEYRPPWRHRPCVTPMPLAPLSKQETLQIVGLRLAVSELPDRLGNLIVDKAEGNPFFAEEIVSFLIERGIVRFEGTRLVYDAPAVAAVLPESLQSLLTARIDRLPAADRTLLQIAAVIGRRFHPSLLTSIAGGKESEVVQRLIALEAADLLRSDSSSDYEFKHVLMREALYDSLLTEQRSDLHSKVAQEIERRSSERIAEVAEALAHHYSQANVPDRTFHYLGLAGRKCLDMYSLEEAEAYFRRALKIHDAMAESCDDGAMARIVIGLLEALYLSGNVLETKRIAELYIPRLEQGPASRELVLALYFLSLMHANLCSFPEGEANAHRALAIAEEIGDIKAIAYARSALFFLNLVQAQTSHDTMQDMGRKLILECESAADNYILNWAYWTVAYYFLMHGLLPEARKWIAKLIATGNERRDQRALGMAYWTLSWVEIHARRYSAAIMHADEAAKVAVTPYDRNAAAIVKASAMVFQGRVHEGLQSLRDVRQWACANGWSYTASGIDLSTASALAASGDLKGAVALLKRGIRAADACGNRMIAAWNRILLAQIYSAVIRTKTAPSLNAIAKNFPIIASVLFFGGKKAHGLLSAAGAQFERSGIVRAQIELNLGVLAAHEQKIAAARAHFATARVAAEAQCAEAVLFDIDKAFAALDNEKFR